VRGRAAMRWADALFALGTAPLQSRVRLDRFRDRSLRRLVVHAYRRVPHYRRAFEARGVHPEEIRSVADLAALPFLSKRTVQQSPRDLLADGFEVERLIERRTSGSTGQPLSIRRSWCEERLLGLVRWRALASLGWRPSDRHAEVEERTLRDPRDRGTPHRILQGTGLFRQERVNALADPEAILAHLVAIRPQVLTGYAGVLARVAGAALERQIGDWRPRLVALHSDTLTPQMRRTTERGFGAPVYEIYDANEANLIAWQCAETGCLHTADDTTLVEVLVDGRPAQPGERGEVVLTALHSYAMPLIRYRIGDLVAQGEPQCRCGQPFATIRAVEGRMFDYFPLPDGRSIHPYEIVNLLGQEAPWISEYRLVQERRDRVVLCYVAREEVPGDALRSLIEAVEARLGPRVEFAAERAFGLDSEGRAKLRVCRSLVASEYEAPKESDPNLP